VSDLAFLPFALPDIGEEEVEAVVSCMRSGWVTTGPYAKAFEEEFAQYLGGDKNLQAISVNSASMGLLLAMEALGVGPGMEVIVPTYTFSASAMMAVHLGANPVLVDVRAKDLNIDPAKIEAAITPRTRAIVVVHFAGLACDMEAIRIIAQRHNLPVIEDAAHALPTRHLGSIIGNNTSDVTVFSFYATKTITCGEGGMVVTCSPRVAQRVKAMRLHGISRDAFDRYTAPGSKWRYEIVAPGSKCNLTDIAAAIGREQLKKSDVFCRRRTEMAHFYMQQFKGLPVRLPAEANGDGDMHAWHLFVLRLLPSAAISRDEFISRMNEAGIGCSVHFIPLHLHPYYQETFGYKIGDFPVAETEFNAAVSLPLYTKMSDSDMKRVAEAVVGILKV
jgi:dTDP-4-amino-4,6-dideoxygalactose transaminase